MNERIKKERLKFISNLERRDRSEKKLYHYHSVLNLSNGIIKYNDINSNSSKELIIKYFGEINELKDSLIDREQSFYFYKEYLLPVGRVLIKKADFRTKGDILKYIVLGIILDLIIFGFLLKSFYVVFTFIFLLIGYLRRKEKIRKNKFFSVNW